MKFDISTLIEAHRTSTVYVLLEWPDVERFSYLDWFWPECYPHRADGDQPYLDNAYFIPITRLLEMEQEA